MGKPYLSHTQISMGLRCGEQYRRRYIEGERLPPGLAMARGTGVHKGIAANFSQKINSHRDMKRSDIIAASVSAFEDTIRDGLTLTDAEKSIAIHISIGETVDVVAEMADVFAVHVAPHYQPTFVEERIRIVFPQAPRDLIAVIDVGTDTQVVDVKTSKREKKRTDILHDRQLTIYDLAYEVREGRSPESVVFETLVIKPSGIHHQKLVGQRTKDDRDALGRTINEFSRMLAAGIFLPANPATDWWCSPDYCGYWRTCPYVNSQAATPTSLNPKKRKKR